MATNALDSVVTVSPSIPLRPDSQRAVITGMGIRSCLGNRLEDVAAALKNNMSGIVCDRKYAELGMKSQVKGRPPEQQEAIDRKVRRFMGEAAVYAYGAACSAIAHAGLRPEQLAGQPRYGLLAGSGGGSTGSLAEVLEVLQRDGLRKIPPTHVPRTMTSTVAAGVSTALGLEGMCYGLVSACATSLQCIGHAAELIQLGKQDLILAGGGEEEHWSESIMFDAMGALSHAFNDTPSEASRPYAANRAGFVIAGGGGMVVVESLAHARQRGARILAEIVGYGVNSDGQDMLTPSGEGAYRCMRMAMEEAKSHGITALDYVNTHGTATLKGDLIELEALERALSASFPDHPPLPFSSTKGQTGHSLGAAGVQEMIYCLLMMHEGFLAAGCNMQPTDAAIDTFKRLQLLTHNQPITPRVCLSNSFGFGGINASLILKQWPEGDRDELRANTTTLGEENQS